MRLIDADKLKIELSELQINPVKNRKIDIAFNDGVKQALQTAMPQIIDDSKTIDAQPVVHAHWTEVEDNYLGDTHYECSACGEEWTFIDGTPEENNCYYCPRCGAKMDEVTEDD